MSAEVTAMALPAVVLRDADVASAARLTEIRRATSGSAWSLAMFRDEVQRTDRRWIVASVYHTPGARVVGYGGLALLAGSAHVMDIAVDPGWQRHGIGRALLEGLIAIADRHDVDGVTLEVRASDDRARRMYRRAGFTETGTRRGYYPNGEDAVIAWRC